MKADASLNFCEQVSANMQEENTKADTVETYKLYKNSTNVYQYGPQFLCWC